MRTQKITPWMSYMNCSEQIYSSLCFRINAIVCFSPGTNRRLHLPPHIKLIETTAVIPKVEE